MYMNPKKKIINNSSNNLVKKGLVSLGLVKVLVVVNKAEYNKIIKL